MKFFGRKRKKNLSVMVFLTGRGSIQIEFEHWEQYLELEILHDRIEFYYVKDTSTEPEESSTVSHEDLPHINDLIKKIVSS